MAGFIYQEAGGYAMLAASKFAIWKLPTSGDKFAPYKNPVAHLNQIVFHSDLDYYNLATVGTVPVTHLSQGPVPGVLVVNTPSLAVINYLTRIVRDDIVLAQHNLGYIPLYLVVDENKNAVPNAFPIQINNGGHRQVSHYATTSQIRMKDVALPGNDNLPALGKTYTTYVFEFPRAEAGAHGFTANLASAILKLGFGKFDISKRRLRRTISGEVADVNIATGRMIDIANGHQRATQADGTVRDTTGNVRNDANGVIVGTCAYNGSFVAPAQIPTKVI